MPDDLYDDAPAAAPAPDGAGDSDGGEASGSAKTAILPKNCFPDAKPGDSITVKVTRVNEQDIEVEPEGCQSDENEESGSAPTPDEGGDNGSPMRSMLED